MVMLPGSREFYERQQENAEINRALMWELKLRPCQDCKLRWHPHVMSFDHKNRATGILKGKNAKKITSLLFYNPIIFRRALMACDVVCWNCHMIRELKRDANDPKVSPYRKEVLIAMLNKLQRGGIMEDLK